VGATRQQVEGLLLRLQPFGRQDLAEPLDDAGHADAPEIEALAAGEDRWSRLLDLLWLRRREHEDDPRRRLLEDLEERVPRLPGQYVGLVDDVDLVAPLVRRRVHGPLAQLARVVHAAVRRR